MITMKMVYLMMTTMVIGKITAIPIMIGGEWMVGAGENELRTDDKGMLMFTYKELPNNDFDVICRKGNKEDHMTVNDMLTKMYGRKVYVVLA